jgi:hypothetical protein
MPDDSHAALAFTIFSLISAFIASADMMSELSFSRFRLSLFSSIYASFHIFDSC